MSARWARVLFAETASCAVTAPCAAAGVALSVYTAVHGTGHFRTGTEWGFNTSPSSPSSRP